MVEEKLIMVTEGKVEYKSKYVKYNYATIIYLD